MTTSPSRWSTSRTIPKSILDAINEHPCAPRLHMSFRENWSRGPKNETATILCGSPRLYSIDTSAHFLDRRAYMAEIQQLLLSCPNLRIFRIHIDHSGCRLGPATIGNFALEPGQMLPPLEELQCDGYSWTKSWAKNMKWSHLRKLDVSDFSMAQEIAPHLTGLRSLKLDHDGFRGSELEGQQRIAEINTFLLNCVLLEELDLTGLTRRIPMSTLERHGEALRYLRLHELEDFVVAQRQVLSVEDLKYLSISCPHLEVLAVDVNRNGRWVCGFTKVLTSTDTVHKAL